MKINSPQKKLFPYFLAIFLFAFLLYGNSIRNNYALDDEMVTLNNQRVEKGLKGIPEILRTFHAIDNKSQYEYRPLVLITYAFEFQFFGRNPHISHFINVLIYSLTCILIFYLLLNLLSGYNLLFPFLITLLFTAHPLHTEVVNNLKSRDELLAMFNSLLALFFFIRFSEFEKKYFLALGFLFLFLAILSKKSAVIFIALIPLTLYFFKNLHWKRILFIAIISLLAFASYAIFKNIMLQEKAVRIFYYFENPLFFETDFLKRISAGLYSIWYYFELLVFPHPLSFYYGYNQIRMAQWSELKVWISLIFHLGIFIYAVKMFRKKHILSYSILFYLIAIFPFSNLIIPVVGIIGERFAYIASLGFCLAMAYLILKLFKIPLEQTKNKFKLNPLFIGLSSVIIILYSFKTITRNPDWKDHLTLYRHDIKHLKKSAKAHSLISNTIYPELFKIPNGTEKNKLINEAVFHYKKSLEIYPDYITSNNNLGSIYFAFLGDYKTANYYFKKAVSLDTNYVEAFFNLSYSYEKLGMNDSAIFYLEKTLSIDKKYKLGYDKLGSLYFSSGQYDKAIAVNLRAAEKFSEKSAMYFVNAGNVYSAKHDTLQALIFFIKAFEQEPNNKDLCTHIAKVYEKINNKEKAEEYFNRINEIGQ